MKITLRREQESIIPKKMAKKNYESPKMDEVKVNVEQDILAGSCSGGSCTSVGYTDESGFECTCAQDANHDA